MARVNVPALNTAQEIDDRARAIKWELSGMVWKAAEEIGCLDQYIVLSSMAIMRREIINMFYDNAIFARRR